jgi:ribonuclease HI
MGTVRLSNLTVTVPTSGSSVTTTVLVPSLPQGDQAGEVVDATSVIGKRLESALGYSGRQKRRLRHSGRMETTVLLEEPEALDAAMIQKEEVAAKASLRPGPSMLPMVHDLTVGSAGYTVTWQNGQRWVGIKTHMGYNQEAYEAECAALARALETAARRQMTPERVTIFTDALAAIWRMALEELSLGQIYALQARKHIATLRRVRPNVTIEIGWCPAHKGRLGKETAD